MGAGMVNQPALVERAFSCSQILSAILAVAATQQTSEITVAHDPQQLIASAVHSHIAACLSPAAANRVGLPAPSPMVGKYTDPATRRSYLKHPRTSVGDFYTARTHRGILRGIRSNPSAAFSRHTKGVQHTLHHDIKHMLRHYVDINNEMVFSTPSEPYKMPPYPKLNGQFDPAFNFEPRLDEDTRELHIPGTFEWSTQHIHDGPQSALHHRGGDKVTQYFSEKKRIQLGWDKPYLDAGQKHRLKQLRRGFAKFFDLTTWRKEGVDADLYERAYQEHLGPWISKRTKKQIAAAIAKNDPVKLEEARRKSMEGDMLDAKADQIDPHVL